MSKIIADGIIFLGSPHFHRSTRFSPWIQYEGEGTTTLRQHHSTVVCMHPELAHHGILRSLIYDAYHPRNIRPFPNQVHHHTSTQRILSGEQCDLCRLSPRKPEHAWVIRIRPSRLSIYPFSQYLSCAQRTRTRRGSNMTQESCF